MWLRSLKMVCLLRSLAEPKRAIDVFGALFARPIDSMGDLLNMATGESLAHLTRLVMEGRARRWLDGEGAVRYQRVDALPAD